MRPAARVVVVVLALILSGFAAHIAAAGGPRAARSDRPNVLLFLVDDLGWQDLSLPLHAERTPFNDRYRTPNVERLAARGVRFSNAYASAPVCTPTRTAIMTGRAPARTHITYWTLHGNTDTSAKFAGLRPPAWRMNGLDESDVPLPRLLRDAGYRTIHVGKAHFGATGTYAADPRDIGFDVNIAGHAAGGPASYLGTQNFSVAGREGRLGTPEAKPSVWDIPGLEAHHGQDVYLTEALALEAERALDAALDDGVPFFMNFAPYAVHAPIMANAKLLEHYPDLDPREAAYATMIESVDLALGRLLDLLERRGALDDTLVIFHSDNGGLSAHARGGAPHVHNAPLRSGKGSAYEGGIRVPLVVAGPGVAHRDAAEASPVISHDLFPTILAAAGAAPPADVTLDGRSMLPLLASADARALAVARADGASRTLGWHMPHFWGPQGPGIAPFSAIRQGDWKLIWFHRDARVELYDLAHDLGETTDRAGDEPVRTAAMLRELRAWLDETGAQRSIDAETGAAVEPPVPAASRVELQEFRHEASGTIVRRGVLRVPEDRGDPTGRQLALELVVLPATGADPAPDPIVFLAGGPGQNAASLWRGFVDDPLRARRDIVLLGQRGTSGDDRLDFAPIGPDDLDILLGPVFDQAAVRTELDRLAAGRDLRRYSSFDASEDLDDARRLLGYAQLNLVGGSYGTRMALVHLRQHGDTVRTAVLNGVAPIAFTNPLFHASAAQTALERIAADCAGDPGCAAAYPDLLARLDAVLARLDAEPAPVTIAHPATGAPVELRLDRAAFAESLRFIMYAEVAEVPYLIDRAWRGDLAPFAERAVATRLGLRAAVAMGMLLCVTCAEDVDRIDPAQIPALTDGTFLGDERVRSQIAACAIWPRSILPEDFGAPVESDVPTLLLSGTHDPVTPPAFGAEAARHLSRSLHLVVPGTHGVGGPCIDGIVARFIETGTTEGLDCGCTASMRLPPFRIDADGR